MLKCLLDMDGVVVDFVRGAAEHHGHDYEDILAKDFDHDGLVSAFNMSPEAFWRDLGERFWANLPPYPEAPKIVSLVEARFGRRNVCVLSSPTRHKGCMPGKLAWIRRHLPDYSRRFLFGPSKEFCSGRQRVLIDDKPENVEDFRKAGGTAFLVPRPWNEFRDREGELLKLLERFLEGVQ